MKGSFKLSPVITATSIIFSSPDKPHSKMTCSRQSHSGSFALSTYSQTLRKILTSAPGLYGRKTGHLPIRINHALSMSSSDPNLTASFTSASENKIFALHLKNDLVALQPFHKQQGWCPAED